MLKEEKHLIDPQKRFLMIDKKAIIRKIGSLPDARNYRADALSRVVGICDGPQDLAENHDSYQAPFTTCTANNPSLPGD